MRILIVFFVAIHSLMAEFFDKTEVVAVFYDNVTLPCSFPFLQGPGSLSVVWAKDNKDGTTSIVHKFTDSKDNLADQDMNYTERTELSLVLSQGKVDLIIRNVTFSDEGTYYCHAVKGRAHGDQVVKLTIRGLNAVTIVHIDGKELLKCICIDEFSNPLLRWHDIVGKDLPGDGTWELTDLGHGRKKLESVLNMDVEANKHYFCQVKEGRLKRTARGVISDGKPVTVPAVKLSE